MNPIAVRLLNQQLAAPQFSDPADLGSATKEDFVQALAEKDIRMDDHRLSYHIRMAEMSGTLCSGELLPMKATYALIANKVKPTSQSWQVYSDYRKVNR